MFFPHHQTPQPGSSKHQSALHDGPGPSNHNGELGASRGAAGGGGGGGNGWGRHPFNPSAMPIPSPSPYPGSNGMLGFPPPHAGPPHHTGGGLSGLHPGSHGHGHPSHPSFGSGGGLGGLGGGLGGHGPGGVFGVGGSMGLFGGPGSGQGSPPKETIPMTQTWQSQLLRADAARLANAPHHRARLAAAASRNSNKPASITISDPNERPTSIVNGDHKRGLSTATDGSGTSSLKPDPSPVMRTRSAAPAGTFEAAGPEQIPVDDDEDEDEEKASDESWNGLDMGGIKLRYLSSAVFAFSHLTSLFINHNSLTTLPAAISKLRALETLDCTGNDLVSIPPELGLLCRLKELLLFDNRLTTLPFELGTLARLETLGIEGNPMDEKFKMMLAEEGTTSLIGYLRDHCQTHPDPPERLWIDLEPDVDSPSYGTQEGFSALSYNTLSPHLASPSWYRAVPEWALKWERRREVILEELLSSDADVVCLQEVLPDSYSDFFLPKLEENGYSGCYAQRGRARMGTMDSSSLKNVDGCATFWKTDKFSLVQTHVIDFTAIALSRMELRSDDLLNRMMNRDNIASIAMLEFRASGARLLVGNSHIFWNQQFSDVKLVQVAILMEELEKIAEEFSRFPPKLNVDAEFNNGRGPPKYESRERGRDIPMVLCVDLNSKARSAVVRFLSNGELPPDDKDFKSHTYGSFTANGLKHHLGLRSSCASFGEMKMTNFTPTFKATIDYIFYSARSLKCTGVLGDVDTEYLEKVVGFPNSNFPSDHIPVLAGFRVRGRP